jgi:hypothetical protein
MIPQSRFRLGSVAVLLLAAVLAPHSGRGQISKASQILLNRGLQLQGMVEYDDLFTLSTFSNANYTTVNWLYTSYQPLLGPAPGFPWGRWVSDLTQMPPLAQETSEGFSDETPYMSQLLNLELGDELNLNDGLTLTNEINWFASVASNYPNTILYINNYGGQVSDATLAAMLGTGLVDMICFDEYPFTAQYDTNAPNDVGPPNTWPFTSWLSELRRYRQNAMSYNVPFATYMQTFNSVQSYDATVYRNPSPSELRFNNSAALAFNAKMLIGFTYNSGAAALFNILPNGYSGDTYTNALYGEQADANVRAANLGRALVCLKPVYDLHNPNDTPPPPGPASAYSTFPDGTTTSILILKGNPSTSSNNPEPIGFQDSVAAPKSYSWWEFQKNDPYLNGWVVTNPGTNNGGVAGPVIIAWFRLLDESLDGPVFTNEVYLMVVNGLTANSGTAAACQQQIKLNFEFGSSGISNLVMLDPESGLLSTTSTTSIGSGKRQLVLNLNGGDAALFKYADGAPFAGHLPPQAPRIGIQISAGLPLLSLSQLTPGAHYELQYSPALPAANWTLLAGLVLTNSSYAYVDRFFTNGGFYRAVGIP